ncbi:hypothetical protein [Nocardia amamiensis]|uniref:hypothetical protein n=1 Tax=Nocardia amamiensis TaxID=404578 RepID=UPI000ADD4886|nr:hypothetical protein [Nocardia amamiensis]
MGSTSDDVPRTEGTEPELVYPNRTGHYYRTLTYPPRPVWVRLDAILVRDPGTPRHVNGAGVIMRGERPGTLTHWLPTVDGDWMGRVTYSIQFADGRPDLHVRDQLVPAYALRPRRGPSASPGPSDSPGP